MSGTQLNLKESVLNTFRRLPIVLEVFLLIAPILVASCIYMYLTIMKVLVDHDMNYYSLTAEYLISIQGDRLVEAMEGDSISESDLRLLPEDILSSRLYNTISNKLEAWFLGNDEGQQRDPIYFRYLIRKADGSCTEFDPRAGILYGVDAGPGEKELTGLISPEELPWEEEGLQKFELGEKGHGVRAFLLSLDVTKSASFGERELFNAGEGGRILICSYIPEDEVTRDCRQRTLKAAVFGLGILILVFTPVFIVIFRSLRGLSVMRDYMDAVTSRTNPRDLKEELIRSEDSSSAEITELLVNFQIMALKIQDYQEDVGSITAMFEPLVPGPVLKLFNKADIREIKPGDRTDAEGAVLRVMLNSGRDADQTEFGERNRVISHILDIMCSMGGLIMELEYSRITAFFPDSGEEISPGRTAEDCIARIKDTDLTDSGIRRINTSVTVGRVTFEVEGTPERMAICLADDAKKAV